ncbi:MAG TPA: hypothetical protein VFB34_11080 [Chloroflexota bacterium]|nr:hypothetical protein [Chloroflexota bacterium]
MRATTPTITTALQSPTQDPYLSAVLKDTFDRPDPNQPSITSGNAGRSAIIKLSGSLAGSYLRAYVNQPGLGSNAQVYSQLVSTPLTNLGWSTYNSRSTTAQGQAGVALAQFGSTIWLFYQRLSDNAICAQTSTDGIGWSAEAVVVNPGQRCYGLASAGNNDLFAAVDDGLSDGKQNVYPYSYSGGIWTAGPAWPTPAQVTGLAVVYSSSTYRLVLGSVTRSSGAPCLSSTNYTGAAWGSLTPIHPLDDVAQGLSCPFPGLALINGTYRVAATHYDSGAASGAAGNRTEIWTSPDFIHWHLEQHLEQSFTNGANPVAGPNGGFSVMDAGTVIHSQAATGNSNPNVDLSDDVLSIHVDERTSHTTRATVVVANQDAQYSPPPPAMRVGTRLELSLGYYPDTVLTHGLYIDHIQTSHTGDEIPTETITLHCSNRARMLDRAVHVEKVHAGATLLYLVNEIATAAGINQASSPGTSQFSQTVDTFAQTYGATWTQHLNRLAQLYGFEWFVDETDTLQLREPQAGDSSSFTYGPAGALPHALETDIHQVRRPNHVRVTGIPATGKPTPFAIAQDSANGQAAGEVHVVTVADRLLPNAAACSIRAQLELRKAQRAATTGTATLPLNPIHQPMDVITIDDDNAGALRLRHIAWTADLQAGSFEQLATVEAL